jgi:hypothetical protein
MSDQARLLQHQAIEAAKQTRNADTCTLPWEACLELHAEELIGAPFAYWIGNRNGAWAFEVWDESE